MDGLLLADKPPGATSHDVVAGVRRALGGVRTGHAGTLDPFATGLLLVLVGRATRVQRLLMALPKTYEVTARLGAQSSTGDPEGEITHTGRIPPRDLALPEGIVRQRPPAYSAVKIDGERAYRRARRGEEVQTSEREVLVHRFEALGRDGDRARFRITCSAGTYVRALISVLEDAYCEQLRRTHIGPFTVDSAVIDSARPAAEQLSGSILPLEEALAFMPVARLEGEAARQAAHGRAVTAPGALAPGEEVLLVDERGAVAVAVARPVEDRWELKPVIGFRS